MAKQKPLKICLATAEFAPLAKTGGLADVCSALSAYLHKNGHDVRVLMPKYSAINTSKLDVQPVDNLQNVPIRIGHRSGVFSIDTAALPGTGMPVYLLRCPELYDRPGIYSSGGDEHLRFILLARAALEMCQRMRFAPDIVHAHDWHAALAPLYLKTTYAWDKLFAATRSVLTIHNIGYQGIFPSDIVNDLDLGDAVHHLHQAELEGGRINFLKTGLLYADLLTTVSPTYAREIQGGDLGMGLQDTLKQRSNALIGILNGVDYDEWNPETDKLIPKNYSAEDPSGKVECKKALMRELGIAGPLNRPLVGIVTRLVAQKGIDLIERVLPAVLSRRNIAVAVLGSGEPRFEEFFGRLHQRFRDRVCFYRGYSNELAHWIEAGSDMFLMPSIYEPCGLNQMYSLRYGTVPIVRDTGGLADSVEQVDPKRGTGTGVKFRDYDEYGLGWAMNFALEMFSNKPLWQKVMQNGMRRNFSWDHQGKLYVDWFRKVAAR